MKVLIADDDPCIRRGSYAQIRRDGFDAVDNAYQHEIEDYMRKHRGAHGIHSVCPDCSVRIDRDNTPVAKMKGKQQ